MILRDRPQYYPLHDLDDTNSVAVESSIFIASGYPTGLPVPSGDHNGKLRSNGLWAAYSDSHSLHPQDWLDDTVNTTLSLTQLTYNTGGNIATTGATVATYGTYLVLGARLELDDAALNAITEFSASPLKLALGLLTLPGRVWLYASANDGMLRYESVGPAVADAPVGSEITLVGLQLDALGVVTDGALVPTTLALPDRYLPINIAIESSADIDSTGTVTAAHIVGGAGASASLASVEATPTTGNASLFVTGNGATLTSQAAARIEGLTGRAMLCTATGTVPSVHVTHSGSGAACYVDASAGTGFALDAVGSLGSVVINATTSTGTAVRGVATGSGIGVRGTGGASSVSRAVYGLSGHDDAQAIVGETPGTASTSAAGVQGIGSGAATGVYGYTIGGTGYAVIAHADTTSPTRAAARLVPQDADPTTPQQGDLLFNSARTAAGKLRIRTTQWESVHSSAKGYVVDVGLSQSGSLIAGASADLSLAQITPEETGEVLVTVTGHLDWSSNLASTTVQIRDATAAATINGGGVGVLEYPNTGAVGRAHSFTARINYTLPSTATRTFAVRLTSAGGKTTYTDVTVSVEGVF